MVVGKDVTGVHIKIPILLERQLTSVCTMSSEDL